MIRKLLAVFTLLTLLAGCKKDESTRSSGIDTIDNTVYKTTTYYSLGFSFSMAKKISNLSVPGPDITLYLDNSNSFSFLTNNYLPSIYKIGDYSDQAAAVSAFNGLKTIGTYQWKDIADQLSANQVWIYRSNDEKYTKIRIISTLNEVRDGKSYGECTFEWLSQPDGSLTFPAK
jgi:hypothetical protein